MTNVLLVLNLCALAGVAGWLFVLQRRAGRLDRQARRLAEESGALSADVATLAREAGVAAPRFFTLEILNPLEVAAKRSKLGAVFGGLTPAIVKYEVHRQTQDILAEQLLQHGIRADVRLHG